MKSDKELKINLRQKEFELLAPAKNKSVAIAAINAGADAVYIAYSKFGARAQAGNSVEDIIDIIDYAHKYRVKVYITLNTILTDKELIEAQKIIRKLTEIKVDGIIIQDFGILKTELPPVRFHASTQCHNNTLEKIKFLEKTGFKRVILPREITTDEIRNIKNNTDIELECFVHGALCVSYSGQCYLSRTGGGRSANRGECAQPCRKRYSVFDNKGNCLVKNKYILSLKDLNLSKRIEELIIAGITSFKIEGRLKDEAYVINTTAYYRQKTDEILEKYSIKRSSRGISHFSFTPDLNKTFNRGYCEFNIDGKKHNIATVDYTSSPGEYIGKVLQVHKKYFTTDSDIILNNADGISFFNDSGELEGTYVNKTEGKKIFPSHIQNIKPDMKIYRNYDKSFYDLLSGSMPERKIPIRIRMRETVSNYILFADDEEGNSSCFIPDKKYEKAQNREKMLNALNTQLSKTGNTEFSVHFVDIGLNNIPYIKISEINEIRRNLIAELQKIRKKNYKQSEFSSPPEICKYPEKILNFKSNIHNEKAKEFFEERGCTVTEYSLESQSDFKNREVMTSKYCIRNQLGLCPKQNKNSKPDNSELILKDESGKKLLAEFVCKECVMKIISV